jgi:hypothetical protein
MARAEARHIPPRAVKPKGWDRDGSFPMLKFNTLKDLRNINQDSSGFSLS